MSDGNDVHLLIVDDDPLIRDSLSLSLAGEFKVYAAESRAQAVNLLRDMPTRPQLALVDLGLPPDPDNTDEGFAIVDEILRLAPETKVIVVTGQDEREHALKAIRMGAYDFYRKPINSDELALIVDRAYHLYELEEENRRLLQARRHVPLSGVITAAPEMLKVCRLVEKVAPTDVTVLLLGESGTGKELVARALHELSPRVDKSFVAINCAAIPENLLESELFGHEKGAFTGALSRREGCFELAHGGTLLLDELGDMPLTLQAKLLRVLEDRRYRRLGSKTETPIDVRVLAATNKDPETAVADGHLRGDLFYRLNVFNVHMPPLRDHKEDLPAIVDRMIAEMNEKHGRSVKGMDAELVLPNLASEYGIFSGGNFSFLRMVSFIIRLAWCITK